MFGLNGEGIQREKVPFFDFIEPNKTILDLASGIKTPYMPFLTLRSPKFITFLDVRFRSNKKGRYYERINTDAFEYLEDKHFDYIWASEFMEHVDPKKQQELFDKIKKCCKYYIITFPTPYHYNFHNDWSHRPVMIPYYAYKTNYENWEGIITNVEGIKNYIIKNHETKYVKVPPNIVSIKRKERGLC